jgi:integrase
MVSVMARPQVLSFSDRVWTIPASRMKRRNPHNVYLSEQALDILVTLKTCAGGSEFIFLAGMMAISR